MNYFAFVADVIIKASVQLKVHFLHDKHGDLPIGLFCGIDKCI